MATAGPSFPGSGTSAATGLANEVAWATPENITADDTSEAQVVAATFDSPDPTNGLVATSFGFSIPAGSTVDGITVDVNRRSIIASSGRDYDGGDATFGMRLLDSTGARVGDNKRDTTTIWPTGLTTQAYGGAADDWNAGLDATDINSANFGCELVARANIANADIAVEWVQITVTYTPPVEPPPKIQTVVSTSAVQRAATW